MTLHQGSHWLTCIGLLTPSITSWFLPSNRGSPGVMGWNPSSTTPMPMPSPLAMRRTTKASAWLGTTQCQATQDDQQEEQRKRTAVSLMLPWGTVLLLSTSCVVDVMTTLQCDLYIFICPACGAQPPRQTVNSNRICYSYSHTIFFY